MTIAVMGATLACAPADEVPSPDREKQARVAEVAQMLHARGAGAAIDTEHLSETLDDLTRFPPADEATRELTSALNAAVSDTHISPASSERVASQMYQLMNGGYLPRSALARVTDDVEQELVATGVSPAAAAAVAVAGVKVAREPRNPRTDWW
jgi:hypothetical protein